MILYIPVLWVFVYLRGIRPLTWTDTPVRPYGWVAASLRQVLRVFRGSKNSLSVWNAFWVSG